MAYAHHGHPLAIMGGARAFFLLQPCPGGASDGAICPPSSCSPPVAGQSPSGTSLTTGQNVGAAAPGQGQPQGAGHGLQFLSPSPDQWNWGATNAHGPTPPMDGGWAPLGLREAPGRAISRSQEDGPQAWSQRGKAYPLVPTPAVPLARGTVPDLGGCPWGTPLCLGSWRSPKGRPTGAGGGPKTDTLRALRCAVLALQDACSLS